MRAKYCDILPAFSVPNADLCQHACFNIYINGQYVESVGNKAEHAAQALAFWQRRGLGVVTWSASTRSVPDCTERRADS